MTDNNTFDSTFNEALHVPAEKRRADYRKTMEGFDEELAQVRTAHERMSEAIEDSSEKQRPGPQYREIDWVPPASWGEPVEVIRTGGLVSEAFGIPYQIEWYALPDGSRRVRRRYRLGIHGLARTE